MSTRWATTAARMPSAMVWGSVGTGARCVRTVPRTTTGGSVRQRFPGCPGSGQGLSSERKIGQPISVFHSSVFGVSLASTR
jgi:hypothetical protein